MSSTMLQLMQQTSSELGLVAPTQVAGNTSQDVIQLLALMNSAGYELLKEYDWRALQKEYRFYTQAISTTGDAVEGSYTLLNVANTTGLNDKWMVNGTGIPQDCSVVAVNGSSVAIALTIAKEQLARPLSRIDIVYSWYFRRATVIVTATNSKIFR